MKNTKKGFTLIELLVVIAIIGILSSVVLASLNNARRKSRDARRMADLQQIKLAAELYFDANGSEYPATLSLLAPEFIGTVPIDPLGVDHPYVYVIASSTTDYCLGADLEDDATASSTQSDEACIISLAGTIDYAVAP